WDTKQTSYNDKLKTLTEESIKCCGKYGVMNLIVAPLFAGIPWDKILDINKEFYSSIITLAKEQGVRILLENQCRDFGGHLNRGLFSKGKEAAEFIDELNETAGEEIFGFAFNSGNVNICAQNAYEELIDLGSRVKVVLISDNDGTSNSKLLPFTSTSEKGLNTDWLNLIRGVRAMDFDGDVVLEYSHSALAASPFLKPALLTYAKKIGDYFLWQFEMDRMVRSYGDRVLFGAGNMCRNYMKNYGEKYPPLYTCDNNRANWGKTFEGLEIKNPEELKQLPENVAVFICNVYYREIETQLKEMGLKNPIVFFNDEYMQSFHFERLEMVAMK
ncbi:MAG: TIM barrel protein, partial [Lachnospiraceae bacterium]|nr:TIM barrel protein [Lachnospiraceae bacterium]